jgi:hypothetical protein
MREEKYLNKKAMKKLLSLILTVLMVTTTVAPSFADVTHYVVTKDGIKYQYAQEDLIASYYGDKQLYNDYLSGDLEALLDDKNGYVKAEDVFRYIASTDKVDVNAYTESDQAKIVEVGQVVKLDASGNPVDKQYVASDFNYGYTQYKPVMQSERNIFVITGFSEKGLEKLKTNGNLVIPKTVEIEEDGLTVTKDVEGIDREAFKGLALDSVVFPETKGEYDFVINASAFAETGLKEVTFNEGIRAIKEEAFAHNNLTEVYFPSTTLTIGSNSFAHNKISNLVFSDDVKAIQIDNYTFYDNDLKEVHLPYSIFKFLGYVFKGNPGTQALEASELDNKDPEGTGIVQLYTRNPEHLTSSTYIATSKYHNIVNVAEGIDRTPLFETIQEAKALVVSDYPQESVNQFLGQLADAKVVFKDEEASQDELNDANQGLKAAIENLKSIGVDKTDLRSLVEKAKGYSPKVYTKETYDLLLSAIEKAEKLLLDPSAKDEALDTSVSNLSEAISKLVVRPELVFTKEDFSYEGNVITGFTPTGEEKFQYNKNLILPDQSPAGVNIEVIGPAAFENSKFESGSDVVTPIDGIETIQLPSQLKRIESTAFRYNCLKEIKFPSTLEYIGNLAFNGNLLESVHLPNSVTELGFGTFSLNRIKAVTLSTNLTEISDGTFSRNIYLGQVELHEGLTRIGQSAFTGCPIKTIKFPSTLNTIGKMAFSSSRLEAVHIPANVEVIEEKAFQQNTKFRTLKEVTLEEGLKSIGKLAFMDGMVSEVNLPKSLETLHETAFKGNINTDKEDIIVKLYTTNANHLAFETPKSVAYQKIMFGSSESDFEMDENGVITAYLGSATEIGIPAEIKGNPVLAIGDKAFYRKKLTVVELPDTIKTIGEKAFYGNDLVAINLPEQLVTINTQAFRGNDIEALIVPSSVETIGSGAFAANKIASLTLSKGVKVIENGAFMSNKLADLVIPGSVEVVPTFAFAMNPDLTNVVLEEGIKEISMNAFTRNSGLTGEVILPSTLEHIYGSSFKGTGVTSYYVKGDKASSLLEVHSTTATNLANIKFESPDKQAYVVFNASGNDVEELVIDLGTLDCAEGTDNLQAYLDEKLSVKESAYHVNKDDSTGKSDEVILADIYWNLENVIFTDGLAVVTGKAKDFTAEDLQSKGVNFTPPNTSDENSRNTYKITLTVNKQVASDFKVDENGVITAYTGTELDVVIPSEVGGVAVKAIGKMTFAKKGIKSVTIPEGVETIGTGSFIKNNLTSVTLPKSIKKIEALAFANNKELVEINLNEGLEVIEKQAFQMTPLNDAIIAIPSTVTAIGDSAFLGQSIDKMIVKGDEKSASIQFGFPIGGNGLNIELESPKKHAEFLWNSFGCGENDNHVNLGTIELSALTKEELQSALANLVHTKIVGIYEAKTSDQEDLRMSKDIPWDLSAVDMTQDTITLTQKISLKDEDFPEKEGYTGPTPSKCTANNYYSLTIKLTGPSIEIDANGVITAYNGSATEVVIPAQVNGITVQEIGEKAFYRKSLTSVTLPDTVTSIGEKAFYGNDLVAIALPEKLVTIQTQAFRGNDIEALIVPSSVETIGSGAFASNKIASLTLSEGVKVIENGAFVSNKLTDLVIPGSVEVVATYAFSRNPNLSSLVLEEGIKEISMNAFTGNSGLTGEIILPSTLEHIYASSFKGTGVTSYYAKGDKASSLLEVHSITATNLANIKFESPDKQAYVVFNASGNDVEEVVIDLGTLDCTAGADNLQAYLEEKLSVKESAYHVNKKDSTGKSDVVILADIDWDLDQVTVTTGAAVVFGTAKAFADGDLQSKGEDFTPPNTGGSPSKNKYKITILIGEKKDLVALPNFKSVKVVVAEK